MPRLGVRFDIDRVESGSYGLECWRTFFEAVDVGQIAPALLYEGDSSASLNGLENAFVVAIECLDDSGLGTVRSALVRHPGFLRLCASPMFVEGAACAAEPLVPAGRVTSDGTLLGDAWNARPALEWVRERGGFRMS
jgi:hypothetical protein